MIRTLIDAGVLIYAARSQGDIAEKALQILEDENRYLLLVFFSN